MRWKDEFPTTGLFNKDIDYIFITQLHVAYIDWSTQRIDDRLLLNSTYAKYINGREKFECWDAWTKITPHIHQTQHLKNIFCL